MYIYNALAFNTLLSSQETDAHHGGTLIPLRGNSPTLLRSSLRVNSVSRIFPEMLPTPTSSGRQQPAPASLASDARPPAGGLLGGSPGPVPPVSGVPSPQGKKNFTTGAYLRQIRGSCPPANRPLPPHNLPDLRQSAQLRPRANHLNISECAFPRHEAR